MCKHKTGSRSRQARRKATKHHASRKANRQRRRRLHGHWRQARSGRTTGTPKAQPQARGYLVQQFWEHFNLGVLLHKAGVKEKLKGLPAVTLMFVALMFGVLGANSVSDLTSQVRIDPYLLDACWMQGLERKQLYRFLGQVRDDNYLAWFGEIVHELNRHPQTAMRRDGVVIGDDTTVFKFGENMPYVTLVYKSSGRRFGLGNIIVSTHYADTDKDYPLFFDFWRPTPEQIAAAQAKRARKRLKVDQRKPEDVARWLAHQVAHHQAPDLAILHGTQFGPLVIGKCEELDLPWMALAVGRRQYVVVRADGTTRGSGSAQDWLKRNYRAAEWIELTDVGQRAILLGHAAVDGVGRVSLVLVEDMADSSRTLLVTRAAADAVVLERTELALAQQAQADTDSSRLDIMLRLLQLTRAAGVPAETAVFDRWFYVPRFIAQVLALGFARVILKAKRNISYTYQGREYTIDQLWSVVPDKRFRRKRVRGQWVKLAAVRVKHGELGRVKLVLVKELGRHNKVLQKYVLMCTDPTFRTEQVYRAHKLRWKIEECYREVRQQHGLELYHARNFNANFGHVALSFLSYLCVVVTRLLTPALHDKTLGQVKRLLFDAWVELERQGEVLIVKFSTQFHRDVGLPAYCT
jgi:hypothetical protein